MTVSGGRVGKDSGRSCFFTIVFFYMLKSKAMGTAVSKYDYSFEQSFWVFLGTAAFCEPEPQFRISTCQKKMIKQIDWYGKGILFPTFTNYLPSTFINHELGCVDVGIILRLVT